MPTYNFYCKSCEDGIEIYFTFQEYDDKAHRLACAECGTDLVQHVGTPHVYCRQEPKTVGHGAARNAEKMGHYEYQEKVHEVEEGRKAAKTSLFEQHGFGTKVERKAKPAWYGHPDKQMVEKINTWTPEQKTRYIVKGEVT